MIKKHNVNYRGRSRVEMLIDQGSQTYSILSSPPGFIEIILKDIKLDTFDESFLKQPWSLLKT